MNPKYETVKIDIASAGQAVNFEIETDINSKRMIGFALQQTANAFTNQHTIQLREQAGRELIAPGTPSNYFHNTVAVAPGLARFCKMDAEGGGKKVTGTWQDGTTGAFSAYSVLLTIAQEME